MGQIEDEETKYNDMEDQKYKRDIDLRGDAERQRKKFETESDEVRDQVSRSSIFGLRCQTQFVQQDLCSAVASSFAILRFPLIDLCIRCFD